jgi:hypothetical protein
MKQWIHLLVTHLLFSRTQGRLRMYLHMISMQRVYMQTLTDRHIDRQMKTFSDRQTHRHTDENILRQTDT